MATKNIVNVESVGSVSTGDKVFINQGSALRQTLVSNLLAQAAAAASTGVARLDVASCTSVDKLGVSAAVPLAIYVCANSKGETSGGTAQCATYLKNLLHPSAQRLDVNLGDVVIAYWDASSASEGARLLPVHEAKTSGDSTYGTFGLMARNDKLNLTNCVEAIDKTCFRCYQGEYNMNNCGWYGYYMYGTLGRPAGSVSGENYVLRVANAGKDGDYIVLEQTCWSATTPEHVFRRTVKTKDRSGMTDANTVWGTWRLVATPVISVSASTTKIHVTSNVSLDSFDFRICRWNKSSKKKEDDYRARYRCRWLRPKTEITSSGSNSYRMTFPDYKLVSEEVSDGTQNFHYTLNCGMHDLLYPFFKFQNVEDPYTVVRLSNNNSGGARKDVSPDINQRNGENVWLYFGFGVFGKGNDYRLASNVARVRMGVSLKEINFSYSSHSIGNGWSVFDDSSPLEGNTFAACI